MCKLSIYRVVLLGELIPSTLSLRSAGDVESRNVRSLLRLALDRRAANIRRRLVLGLAALLAPSADGRYVSVDTLLLGLIRTRRELDETVQRNVHPRALILRRAHEVGVDAAQDGLVGDDEDVLAALELHDDGLEADDDVAVGLAAGVAVVVLVGVAGGEVVGVLLLDLGVGEAVADAGVQLVERFPGELFVGQVVCCLGGAFEGRGPYGEGTVAGGLLDEIGQDLGVLLAARRKVGVSADLAGNVVHGLAVLESRRSVWRNSQD